MATSASAVSNLPEGYSLEQPSTPQPQQGTVAGLPAGYTLEKDNQPSTQPQTADVDLSTISTGGEGSNSDQQLMSEESQKSATKGGLIAGAAGAAGIAGALALPSVGASTVAAALPTVIDKAKAVVQWATANPIKSYAIGKIADELGIHPFDLMHSVVKYGKNLFGDSETK
jgi:hypothetical protein